MGSRRCSNLLSPIDYMLQRAGALILLKFVSLITSSLIQVLSNSMCTEWVNE